MNKTTLLQIERYLLDSEQLIIDSEPGLGNESFSQFLAAWGALIHKNQIVLLFLSNHSNLLKHYYALFLLGAIPILFPPNTPTYRIKQLCALTGAHFIVKNRIDPGDPFIDNLPPIGHSHILPGTAARPLPAPWFSHGDSVLSTSGTSGFGSFCIFSFEALLRNATKHANIIALTSSDRLFINLPLYYSYAFVAQALAAMLRHAPMVIAGPPFSVTQYQQCIHHYGITASSITPLIAKALIEQQAQLTHPLRVLTVGGDQLHADRVQQLLNLQLSKELYITYGLTEAGPRVSTLKAHEESEKRFASVGKPLENVTVHLKHCINDVGELYIHSDTLMKRTLVHQQDQWLSHEITDAIASGDLFTIEDDYLYFKGRQRDFIIYRGEKIALRSVAKTVETIPHVIAAKLLYCNKEPDQLKLTVMIHHRDADLESAISKEIYRRLFSFERPSIIEFHPVNIGILNYK